MALSPEELAKLQQKLQEIERLSRLLGANINTINLQPLEANAGNIESIFERLTNQAKRLGEETDFLISNFQRLVGEIKNSNTGVGQVSRSLRSLSSITEQIASFQKGYNDLSSKEIAKLRDKAKIETDRLIRAKQLLEEEARLIEQKIKFGNLDDKQLQSEQNKLAKINVTRENTIALLENEDITLGELNNRFKDAELSAKHIEKTLGLTGSILKGIARIPILGNIIDTNSALKAAKDNIKEGGDRTSAMSAAFKNVGKQLKADLTDPLLVGGVLITEMVEALIKGDKATGDLAKAFNITYEEANGVREQLTNISNTSGELAINTRALQESLIAVGKTLGSNAMLNEKDLIFLTQMREMAGMTNEEMVSLERTTLATGGNLKDNVKYIQYTAKTTGLANGVLLNEKDIMRDIAKASDAIKLSLDGNPDALGRAVTQAKALGLSLDQIDKSAESLLNFESSITNELSAELITGKNLNLEQARLYALNNNMEGLSKEIAKNFGTAAEFSKMNRIQQESIAKTVGMSREELAKTLTNQEALKSISKDQVKNAQKALDLARARGMSEDEIAQQGVDNLMKQQSLQERFNNTVEKLKELFISISEPILEIVSPLTDLLLDVLPPIIKILEPILGVLRATADAISGIIKMITLDFSGAANSFSNMGPHLMEGLKGWGINTEPSAKMADGGIVTKPINNVTVGEAGPEAIIPLNSSKTNKFLNISQNIDLSPLLEELKALRQEQAKSNEKPIMVENSVNGTRFGTAVAMNTYRIQ